MELVVLKETDTSPGLQTVSKSVCSERNEFYINQWKSKQHKNFMERFYEMNITTKADNAFAFDLSEDREGCNVRPFPYSACESLLKTFQTEFGGWKMNPHVITMQVLITGVSDLDPVGGCFNAKGQFWFRWWEPKFEDRMVYEPGTTVPLSDMPSAQAIFDALNGANSIEFTKTAHEYVHIQQFPHDPIGCATFCVEFEGSFLENFELNQFPFDVQQLKIFFELTLAPGNYRWGSICIPDYQMTTKEMSRDLYVWEFGLIDLVFSEWQVYEPQVLFGNQSFGASSGQPMYPTYCISLQFRRKYDGWLKNVFLLLWLISSFSFSAFSLDPMEHHGDRIGIILTLLLTATAFKFVISDSLPKVTYMTVLDKYVAVCNLGFTIFIILFSLLPIMDVSEIRTVELMYFLPILSAVWVVFNIVFLYRVWRVNNLHKAKLGKPMRKIHKIKNQGYRVL